VLFQLEKANFFGIYQWQKHPSKREQLKSRSFQLGLLTDVSSADADTLSCGILVFAESVFASWPTKEKFLASKNQVGN
jgi:hypothetical protein